MSFLYVTASDSKGFPGHKETISFARFKDPVLAHSHAHFIPMYMYPKYTYISDLCTVGCGQSANFLTLDGFEGGPLSILQGDEWPV
jgi:hypothetical protein